MWCNLKEMVDIVEIAQAVVMVDIVDIVDIVVVNDTGIVFTGISDFVIVVRNFNFFK